MLDETSELQDHDELPDEFFEDCEFLRQFKSNEEEEFQFPSLDKLRPLWVEFNRV